MAETGLPEVGGALPPVTEDLLAGMEWRYAVPRCCRVCGAPLQVSDSKGRKMTCTSDAASPLRGKYEAAGATWKEALEHSQASTLYDPPDGDRRVLALVAEIRRLRNGEQS
jgi:hypothetical protein